jgi:hypothetical protein
MLVARYEYFITVIQTLKQTHKQTNSKEASVIVSVPSSAVANGLTSHHTLSATWRADFYESATSCVPV